MNEKPLEIMEELHRVLIADGITSMQSNYDFERNRGKISGKSKKGDIGLKIERISKSNFSTMTTRTIHRPHVEVSVLDENYADKFPILHSFLYEQSDIKEEPKFYFKG